MMDMERQMLHDAPQNLSTKALNRRRISVSAECEQITSAEIRSIPKTKEEYSDIVKRTSGNFLFSDLEDEQLERIIDSMEKRQISAESVLIQQNDDGDYFYLIKEGIFEVLIDGKVMPFLFYF